MPRRIDKTAARPLSSVPPLADPELDGAGRAEAEVIEAQRVLDEDTAMIPPAGVLSEDDSAIDTKPARKRRAPVKKETTKRAIGGGLEPGDPEAEGAAPDDVVSFASLDDSAEYLSALLYGAEGTGKTTGAALMTSISPTGNVLVVNAEAGLKKRALASHGVDTSRVMVWPPEGDRVTFEGLESLFYRLASDLEDNPSSWLGTVWDSATDIHQELLDQVVEAEMAKQTEILEKAGNKGRAGNIVLRDRFDNDRDDYRRMSNQFRTLLRKFRYLPCHFAVTALLRIDEDERTKRKTSGPAVTPAIQNDLTGYVDQVLLCKVADMKGGRVFFAQTVATSSERAKDRHNVLPEEMVNPTFDRLYKYMVGELKEADDPLQLALATGNSTSVATKMAAKPTDAAPAEEVKVTASGRVNTRGNRRRTASSKTAAIPAATGGFEDEPPF